jgi:hypothetical protein
MTSCKSENNEVAKDTTPAISVKVSKVSLHKNGQFLAVSGKIQAASSADLSTRMMGYVTKVHVNVGDKVQKGQLLVSIDNDAFAFLTVSGKVTERIIFDGWMIASSPALSALEHPRYDVWVLKCLPYLKGNFMYQSTF